MDKAVSKASLFFASITLPHYLITALISLIKRFTTLHTTLFDVGLVCLQYKKII